MDDSNWDPSMLDRLRSVVFRRGVDEIASQIPANRVTVYRLINGHTRKPSLSVRARIVAIVEENETEESNHDSHRN